VFAPANLLREGRRQRRLADIAVPAVDLRDPNGDISATSLASGRGDIPGGPATTPGCRPWISTASRSGSSEWLSAVETRNMLRELDTEFPAPSEHSDQRSGWAAVERVTRPTTEGSAEPDKTIDPMVSLPLIHPDLGSQFSAAARESATAAADRLRTSPCTQSPDVATASHQGAVSYS
jgi:hypothetical protein